MSPAVARLGSTAAAATAPAAPVMISVTAPEGVTFAAAMMEAPPKICAVCLRSLPRLMVDLHCVVPSFRRGRLSVTTLHSGSSRAISGGAGRNLQCCVGGPAASAPTSLARAFPLDASEGKSFKVDP